MTRRCVSLGLTFANSGKSVGFDVHTRKRDFLLDSAGYTPVISDGRHLYVAGYYTFFALAPKRGG